jgi:hypothetical protein
MLNDAFDANWSFEIIRHEIVEDKGEIVVLGKLNTDGVVKSQFGSSGITRAVETGEIISLADDLKAGATDSLKKCATLLEAGIHLYNGYKPMTDWTQQGGPNNGGNRMKGSPQGRNGGKGGNHDIEIRDMEALESAINNPVLRSI